MTPVRSTALVACFVLLGCSSESNHPGRANGPGGGNSGTLPDASPDVSGATGGAAAEGGAAGAGGADSLGGAAGQDQGGGGAGGSSEEDAGTGIPPEWGSSCSAPTGVGTVHTNNVTANEQWLAADSPHSVPENLEISGRLTLESCAVVEVGAGRTLSVVGSGQLATLVVEPGAMLRFGLVSALSVDVSGATNPARGALVAAGTAADPVLFTSALAAPAAGDWVGILLGGVVDPSTVIDHARVEYAGGSSNAPSSSCLIPGIYGRQNDAAIRIIGGLPPRTFVTNTVIADSGANGIDRGYLAPYPDGGDPGPDFMPSNAFQNIAWCAQTYPGPLSGNCPDPLPCP